MKTLDMADTYPPPPDRDTLPPSDWEEDTIVSERNPALERLQYQDKRYPGIGLLIVFATGFLFWGAVFFFACR